MESVKELNATLKGEYMAIHAYRQFIGKTNDPQVSNALKKILEDHQRHAEIITARIESLGGEPVDGVGIMGEVMLKLKGLGQKETEAILKDAFTGEEKGIGMTEEIIKGDLDENSMSMIRQILKQDKEHLGDLLDLLQSQSEH